MKAKSLLFIMLLIVSITSCKKKETPTPASPVTSTPINSVDTTKTKLYFDVILPSFITNIVDYKQDTANTRMYHNTQLIKNNYTLYHADASGLNHVSNFNAWTIPSYSGDKPILVAHGDSIVFELDHLEYSADLTYGWNPIHDDKAIRIYDANKILITTIAIYDNSLNTRLPLNSTGTDQHLGTGSNTSNQIFDFYLGKKFRAVYKLP